MQQPPAEIRTSRLLLRPWVEADAEALNAAVEASRVHLTPWMWWAAEDLSTSRRRELIATFERDRIEGGDTVYGVFLGDAIVGGTGLHHRSGPGVLDIGYWIHVDHLHHGYATEVTAALTDAAFALQGIERVDIHHDRANHASRAVPHRLGFTMVGEAPDDVRSPGEEGVDVHWSIDRPTWLARIPPLG